jgi:hypothetical protein
MPLDLGISKGGNRSDEDYAVKFLSQLEYGAEITGEVYIGELKQRELKGKPISEFYVIVTDHENEQKWICGLIVSAYYEGEYPKIYGERGGRTYALIDSINAAINGTPRNEEESYSLIFETFRANINDVVETATFNAVKPESPNAKAPNIVMVSAKMVTGEETAKK